MGRKKKKSPAGGAESESLKNNPFAALLGDESSKPGSSPASTTPASTPASATPPGGPQQSGKGTSEPKRFPNKVVVRREKKGRGGKTITRISGIPAEHRGELQKTMKKALGCGATIEDDDLVLLGSLVDRAADYLEKQGAKRVVRSN